MTGGSIDEATDVYCDNEGVVESSLKEESTLKKKHLSTCYPYVRECRAKLAARMMHCVADEMLDDIATKILNPHKKRRIAERIFYLAN